MVCFVAMIGVEYMIFQGKAIIYSTYRKSGIVPGYRPHLAKKNSDELYGVEFVDISETALDKYVDCKFKTSYENVDYSILHLDEKYDIREGSKSVGEVIITGKTEFYEHQMVKAARDISANIKEGCIGVIVFVITEPSEGFLVEFFDDKSNTIDIVEVKKEDIMVV